MIGRLVILDTGWQTVGTAVQDLLEVKLGTAQAGFLLSAKVIQKTAEDANSADQLDLNIKRATGSFTSGSGGGTATVLKGQSGDAAHGLAANERNNTTQAAAGTGTLETLEPGAFNILSGEWEWKPPSDEVIPLGPSEAAVLSIDTALDIQLSVRAVVKILITHG